MHCRSYVLFAQNSVQSLLFIVEAFSAQGIKQSVMSFFSVLLFPVRYRSSIQSDLPQNAKNCSKHDAVSIRRAHHYRTGVKTLLH